MPRPPERGRVGLKSQTEDPEDLMIANRIAKAACGALVTGIATLALAAPASAVHTVEPEGGTPDTGTTSVSTGSGLAQVATGALGGIALAGAGIAVVTGVRRHNHHFAHPA
jgi:hypothetical protein